MESLNVQRDKTFFALRSNETTLVAGNGTAGTNTYKNAPNSATASVTVGTTVVSGNLSWTLESLRASGYTFFKYKSDAVPLEYNSIDGYGSGWANGICPQSSSDVKVSSCLIPAKAKFADCSKAEIL
jgi:hypothetical protein